MTQARVKSADAFERRYKRDRDHDKMNEMHKQFEADEKHFEEKVIPRSQRNLDRVDRILKRRPRYSCDLIFFREIEEGDEEKHKSTIQRDGKKYRQIFAGFASVQGDIMPFNNKRTYRTDSTEIWNKLIHILRTDSGIKRVIEVLEDSTKIDVIVVKGAVLINENAVNNFKPLKRKLFSSVSAQAVICNIIGLSRQNQDME